MRTVSLAERPAIQTRGGQAQPEATDPQHSTPAKPARKDAAQPLDAAQFVDALLKMQTVTALTGLSSSSIYRLVAAGELKPIKRGTRCTRFRAGDVNAWLRAQGDPVMGGAA